MEKKDLKKETELTFLRCNSKFNVWYSKVAYGKIIKKEEWNKFFDEILLPLNNEKINLINVNINKLFQFKGDLSDFSLYLKIILDILHMDFLVKYE